jgi:hypothetical protein
MRSSRRLAPPEAFSAGFDADPPYLFADMSASKSSPGFADKLRAAPYVACLRPMACALILMLCVRCPLPAAAGDCTTPLRARCTERAAAACPHTRPTPPCNIASRIPNSGRSGTQRFSGTCRFFQGRVTLLEFLFFQRQSSAVWAHRRPVCRDDWLGIWQGRQPHEGTSASVSRAFRRQGCAKLLLTRILRKYSLARACLSTRTATRGS